MRFGKRNGKAATLTKAQVIEMRRRYQAGETQSALCRVYGVSVGQVGRIVRGESWQHVAEGLPAAFSAEESGLNLLRMQENGTLRGPTTSEEIAESATRMLKLQEELEQEAAKPDAGYL